jgi:hypothetical protein
LKAKKEKELSKSEEPKAIKTDSSVQDLIKGLQSSFDEKLSTMASSVNDIIKGIVDENQLLKSQSTEKQDELIKAKSAFEAAKSQYESLANKAQAPKSITTQAYIQKGDSPEAFRGEEMSVSNKKAILAKAESFIDWSAVENGDKIEKGYAESLNDIQYKNELPQGVIKRFRDNGISLVP